MIQKYGYYALPGNSQYRAMVIYQNFHALEVLSLVRNLF